MLMVLGTHTATIQLQPADKNVEFLTVTLLMTCPSSGITFGQAIESLEELLA